ncbi:hypothetical protein CWB77_09365 [Pseudoalteromonas sp. S1610]|nr:hypothetical protein CWB77_09365 [Pseudoalteromonas sp. S1610]
MQIIEIFNSLKLEAACRVLADTERGLTGPEIGCLIQDCKIKDVTPSITKLKRATYSAAIKLETAQLCS